MPHEGYADPIMNDRHGFHSNIPVCELTERVNQAIKASDVSSAPPVAETTDGVTHEIQLTSTEPNEAWGLKPPDPNSGIRPIEVRRPASKGLEAASRQTEPVEKCR